MADRSASTKPKPARARRPIIPPGSLGTALAGLPRPWSVFRHWQFSAFDADHGEGGGGLYIVLHPEKGIALVDSDLAAPFSALLRLRHLLQATQFEPFLHDQPPVIALALHRDELANIEQRLSKALASAGACQIADANWTTVAVTAVASYNLQLIEVRDGGSSVLLHAAAAGAPPPAQASAAPVARDGLGQMAQPEARAPSGTPASAHWTAVRKRTARAAGIGGRLCLRLWLARGGLLTAPQNAARHAGQAARLGGARLLSAIRLSFAAPARALRDVAATVARGCETAFATAGRATSEAFGAALRSLHDLSGRASSAVHALDRMIRKSWKSARQVCERGGAAALTGLGGACTATLACRNGLPGAFRAAMKYPRAKHVLDVQSREAQGGVANAPAAASERRIQKLTAAIGRLEEPARQSLEALRIRARAFASQLKAIPIRAPTRFDRGSIALGFAGTSLGVVAALILIHPDEAQGPALRKTSDPVPMATKPVGPSDIAIPLQPRIAPPSFTVLPAAIPDIGLQGLPSATSAATPSGTANSIADGREAAPSPPRSRADKRTTLRAAPARSENPVEEAAPRAPIEVVTLPPPRREPPPKRERRINRTASPYDGPEYDYANRQID